jgi:DNA-binding response OmpR family regulator
MRVLIAHAKEASRSQLADTVTRGRRLPLDVLHVDNGPDALDLLLADDPPEVALVDWDLPGIEAPEMCRLVRDFHQHHDSWIIVLTPPTHRGSASEAWRAGADDCVFTPAPAKLLSERVTKGLCEMAPPIREAAAAAEAAAQAAAHAAAEEVAAGRQEQQEAARSLLQAVAPAAVDLGMAAAPETARPAPEPFPHPTLAAVCRPDEPDALDEAPAGLAADLKATVDPDDYGEPVELAAAPRLAAKCAGPDLCDDGPRGHGTLEAVLARL